MVDGVPDTRQETSAASLASTQRAWQILNKTKASVGSVIRDRHSSMHAPSSGLAQGLGVGGVVMEGGRGKNNKN